ncbi:MAG: LamG domain-containing protein [Candidatus Poribacteria bacterium]|nr:LamG domain-containing protein [Candidatus Poribacteria bacterium]
MRNFIVMLFTAVLLAASLQITCAAEELKGLVVYFNFENGAGETVTDQSGNRQNGILEGDTDWTKGKYGKGLNFGGENGIVRVVHSRQFEFTEGITICAWIRPTLKRGPGEWQLIAAKGPDTDEFFEILLHPDGFIWMGWKLLDGRVVPQKSLNKIAKDKWQHVAVSFQRGEWWTVYLDGEVLIDHPKQDAKLVPVESPLLLGTEEPLNLNRYYNGDMDEFAMFNRGLSQKEIRKIQGGIENILAVEPTDKLSITWGTLKQKYNMRSVSN